MAPEPELVRCGEVSCAVVWFGTQTGTGTGARTGTDTRTGTWTGIRPGIGTGTGTRTGTRTGSGSRTRTGNGGHHQEPGTMTGARNRTKTRTSNRTKLSDPENMRHNSCRERWHIVVSLKANLPFQGPCAETSTAVGRGGEEQRVTSATVFRLR
ncbi:hypothetical protein INR49_019729 [Caranx melampygus]|nr:hypothetical protein INR49_019729 [Caranx melampygus]